MPVSPKEKKEGEDRVFPEPEPVVSERERQRREEKDDRKGRKRVKKEWI